MHASRRSFLKVGMASLAPAALAGKSSLKIGVTDWNLKQEAKIEAVAMASSLGFDGVQVSIGHKPVDNRLPLDDPSLQQSYLAACKEHKIPVDGTCLEILHTNYLKNDKLGQKWVADGIRVTKALNTKVMLL